MPYAATSGAPKASVEYHRPDSPLVLALNDDGVTYSPVTGMLVNLPTPEFTVVGGKLVYSDGSSRSFIVNGTSDLEVSKATDITYQVFINGTPVPGETTVTSFTAAGKKRNISITSKIMLNSGDEVEIKALGDGSTASVSLTINKLDMIFSEVD